MANPIVTAAIAAAKAAAKKRAVAELKTGNVRKVKQSINSPKMQRKYENLTKGSNTLKPATKRVSVKKVK